MGEEVEGLGFGEGSLRGLGGWWTGGAVGGAVGGVGFGEGIGEGELGVGAGAGAEDAGAPAAWERVC